MAEISMTKRCWAAKRASFGWNSIGRETKDRSIPPDSASGILRSRPDFSSFLPPCTRAACCARHVNAFFGVVVVVVLVGGKLTHRVLAPLRFFLPSVRSCSRFRVSYEGNLISLRLSLSRGKYFRHDENIPRRFERVFWQRSY